jgi:hypothetical protein
MAAEDALTVLRLAEELVRGFLADRAGEGGSDRAGR